jgi:exportin-2 (importin alpha re-exporter)
MALENYFVMIMQIILQRLQNSKTENLTMRFIRFFQDDVDIDGGE